MSVLPVDGDCLGHPGPSEESGRRMSNIPPREGRLPLQLGLVTEPLLNWTLVEVMDWLVDAVSEIKALDAVMVTRAERRARADFSPAPTRGDSFQALCGCLARHRWSAAGAEAVFVDSADRER
jgi:hypothetical protein